MAYNDKYIKAFSTRSDLDDKIKVNITENPDMMYWYIEFNLRLDPSSVSSKTMNVTDRNGYILETEISYIEERNLIKIEPLEKYEENQYYVLNISERVRSLHKNNLKEKVHILFKIKRQQIASIKILPSNVKLPEPKHKKGYKKVRKRAESKSRLYSFQKGNDFDRENLPIADIRINPIVGAVGLLLVAAAFFMKMDTLMLLSAGIAVVGFVHIIIQMYAPETRSAIIYNLGVAFFNKEKYKTADKLFNRALELDQGNEYAEYAVNKMTFFK